MSNIPKDFINSSASKIGKDSLEIDLRNACSRAYYSVFHTANVVAEKKGLPKPRPNKKGTHEKLADRYLQVPYLRAVGDKIHLLHKRRCWADYDIDIDIRLADTEHHIKLCENIISRLERL